MADDLPDDPASRLLADAYGTDSRSTADVLGQMPQPSWHDRYVKPWGSAALAQQQPNWFGKNVLGTVGKLSDAMPPGVGDAILAGLLGPRARIRAYHGSSDGPYRNAADLPKFSPHSNHEIGPHFGTAEQANSRLQYRADHERTGLDDAYVTPVDLHLKNPLEIRDPGMFDAHNLPHALESTGKFDPADIARLQKHEAALYEAEVASEERRATAAFHRDLQSLLGQHGYDSLMYRNTSEHPAINAIMRELHAPDLDADAGARSALFKQKEALEERLAKEGDYSYVPIKRGTVKSATTGDTLFSSLPAAGASLAAILSQYGGEDKQ